MRLRPLSTCRRMRHQSSLIAVLWFGANVLPRQPSVGHRVGGLHRIPGLYQRITRKGDSTNLVTVNHELLDWMLNRDRVF